MKNTATLVVRKWNYSAGERSYKLGLYTGVYCLKRGVGTPFLPHYTPDCTWIYSHHVLKDSVVLFQNRPEVNSLFQFRSWRSIQMTKHTDGESLSGRDNQDWKIYSVTPVQKAQTAFKEFQRLFFIQRVRSSSVLKNIYRLSTFHNI